MFFTGMAAFMCSFAYVCFSYLPVGVGVGGALFFDGTVFPMDLAEFYSRSSIFAAIGFASIFAGQWCAGNVDSV